MPVDEELFQSLRKRRREDLQSFLEQVYGPVHRMAYALGGREDVGNGIIRFVITQGLRHLDSWRDAEMAERWFWHHTVLTSRRAQRHPPGAKDDVLLRSARGPDAQYAAFVRTLRDLPFQQREAFILHHGERFDSRRLAIAMDCSTHAAAMHLHAAHDAIKALVGPSFAAMNDRMTRAYVGLTAAESLMRPAIRRHVARSLWPRRLRRAIAAIAALALLATAAWAGVRFGFFRRFGW